MGREVGHDLLVDLLDFGLFLHVELAAFRDGFGDVVHLGQAVQARDGDDGVGVEDVADGQAGALVVLFPFAR